MTFWQLFLDFHKKYGNDQDAIFFELLLFFSKKIKDKPSFLLNRSVLIDFDVKKFNNACKQYYDLKKPLAYITKKITFLDQTFAIENKVLAPRDVTLNMISNFISQHKNNKTKIKILDLCCGSGIIGLSLKKHIKNCNVVCVDKYQNAIDVIKKNAKSLKQIISTIKADAISYLNKMKCVDFIISNPPYISCKQIKKYTDLYKWESKNALFAKNDGLYFYEQYFKWLNSHKFIECWLEHGYDQVLKLKLLSKKYKNLKIMWKQQYIIVKKNTTDIY